MDTDGITLTSYFGEQHRSDGKLVGDALIELYGQQEVAASAVLGGAVIAVDTAPRISALIGETRRINRRGLVTVERTRFLSGDIEPIVPSGDAGEAAKLTVHCGRQDTVYGVPAFEVMCELLHRRGVGGATALAGVDGTAAGRRQRGHLFSRGADVPMIVVAIGAAKLIGTVLPDLGDLLRSPRMTLSRIQVCKRDGELIRAPEMPAIYDDDGHPVWQKLTVFASAAAQHQGHPVHRTLVRRLGGQHFRPLGHHGPAVTVLIDAPQRVAAAFAVIDELTAEHGLVTCENVAIMAPVESR